MSRTGLQKTAPWLFFSLREISIQRWPPCSMSPTRWHRRPLHLAHGRSGRVFLPLCYPALASTHCPMFGSIFTFPIFLFLSSPFQLSLKLGFFLWIPKLKSMMEISCMLNSACSPQTSYQSKWNKSESTQLYGNSTSSSFHTYTINVKDLGIAIFASYWYNIPLATFFLIVLFKSISLCSYH